MIFAPARSLVTLLRRIFVLFFHASFSVPIAARACSHAHMHMHAVRIQTLTYVVAVRACVESRRVCRRPCREVLAGLARALVGLEAWTM